MKDSNKFKYWPYSSDEANSGDLFKAVCNVYFEYFRFIKLIQGFRRLKNDHQKCIALKNLEKVLRIKAITEYSKPANFTYS